MQAQSPGWAVHLGACVRDWGVVAGVRLGWELGAILCNTNTLAEWFHLPRWPCPVPGAVATLLHRPPKDLTILHDFLEVGRHFPPEYLILEVHDGEISSGKTMMDRLP